jgi:two-component system chemotaxis response regulator CheY
MGDYVPFSPESESDTEAGFGWRETPALRRARVLLVDDSRHDILLAKHYLVDSGALDFDLVSARSAQEAMEALLTAQAEGRPIDLILLDISMPGDSGFTLLTRIRDHPRLRRIQVVMCTGSSLDLDRRQARHLGIVGYMVKPPSPEKLLDIVQALPLFDVEEDGGGARLMTVLSDSSQL